MVLASYCLTAQTIFNPQENYSDSGSFYDIDSLRQIYISFEDENYHEILVNSFFDDPEYRIPASVTMNGIQADSAGVRYKGNSTFCLPNDENNPKLPFNIDMNYWKSGQTLMDFKKMKLANAWMDPTFAKEAIAAKIYRKYLPTPEVNAMELIVQDEFLGLYINTESINKQFLSKHFNEKDGVLFKCDGAGVFCGNSSGGEPVLSWLGTDTSAYYSSYDLKSENGWEELVHFIDVLNHEPDELHTVLNIDRVLWAFAVNSVVANLDTYNGYFVHNYYLYQTEDGRFQMIPWDLDNSFVGALLGWSFFNPSAFYEYSPYNGDGNEGNALRPLTDVLLNHPRYRKQYNAHLRTVLQESLDYNAIETMAEELQNLILPAVQSDENKQYTIAQFSNNVDNAIFAGWGNAGILSTVEPRKAYLDSHPELNVMKPEISNLKADDYLVSVTIEDASDVQLMYRSKGETIFTAIEMFDDGMNGDLITNDGIYSAFLPVLEMNQYEFYITASNDDAMQLLPERAEYEFFEHEVEQNTSIQSVENQIFTFTPNIATSEVHINHHWDHLFPYTIRDARGELMIKESSLNGSVYIDITNWPTGLYIIEVAGKTQKFVKR